MIELSEDVLAWVKGAVGAQVIGIEGLREGGSPWLLHLDGGKLTAVVLRTCEPDAPGMSQQFETEAAALVAAAELGVAAPRLIAADVDGRTTGMLAVLSTAVAGSSLIPVQPTAERLRAIGAQAAALHGVPMQVRPGLPFRDRPIADVDFAAMRRAHGLTPLFEEAEAATAQIPDFGDDAVLVHGDLWHGNTMWDGDQMTAMVDWDAAGVGHFGVDLGSLRCDAAIFFGLDAIDEVLTGWQLASARDAPDPQVIAYWDVVAALSSPPDMADVLHVFHGQGRADLDAATVNHRRETFLRSALDRLKT